MDVTLSLSDIPDTVVARCILPLLSGRHVVQLGATNKRYRALIKSRSLWKRLLRLDMPQVPPFLLADNPKHDYYQIYTGLMRYQILTLARSGIEYHWPPSPGLEISVSPLEDTTFQGQQEISPSPFNPPIPHSTYLYHAYPYDTNTIKLPEDECVVACLRVHMGVRCWLTSSGDIYTSASTLSQPQGCNQNRDTDGFARVPLPYKVDRWMLMRNLLVVIDEEGIWRLLKNRHEIYRFTEDDETVTTTSPSSIRQVFATRLHAGCIDGEGEVTLWRMTSIPRVGEGQSYKSAKELRIGTFEVESIVLSDLVDPGETMRSLAMPQTGYRMVSPHENGVFACMDNGDVCVYRSVPDQGCSRSKVTEFSDLRTIGIRTAQSSLVAWDTRGNLRFAKITPNRLDGTISRHLPLPEHVNIVEVSLGFQPDVVIHTSDGKIWAWRDPANEEASAEAVIQRLSFPELDYDPFVYSISGDDPGSKTILTLGPPRARSGGN